MIIFGFRGYVRTLAIVTFVCGHCQTPAAQRVFQRIRKFTLFFVPLFPISSSYAVTCTFCGQTTTLSQEWADQYVAHAAASSAPATGTAVIEPPAR